MMNWKLIFQLSLFGLIMACGTISLIAQMFEPAFWIPIWLFCAYIIASRRTGKYFLHGFLLGMVNSVWVTAAHLISYTTYISKHASMETIGPNMHFLANHPKELMLILCPVFGAIFGLVQGLFAFIASKIVKDKTPGVQV